MKLEYVTVDTIKAGMKEVVTRFGDEAVLLKTLKEGARYRLLVAHGGDQNDARDHYPQPIPAQTESTIDKDSPLSLADMDLVTGQRRQARPLTLATTRLTPSSAQSIKNLVRDESALAEKPLRRRRARSVSGNPSPARSMRRLRRHPESTAMLNFLDTTGLANVFRTQLLPTLAETPAEQSLFDSLADIVCGQLPRCVDVDLSRSLHILSGGYGTGKTSMAFKMAQQINTHEAGRAIVVNYARNQESSWTTSAILGARLGVDVLPASSASELAAIVLEKQSAHLLLIDVSSDSEEDLVGLREDFPKASFHLVAPSDACLSNLQRLARAYTWDSLMITRLDSPSFSWSVYQVLSETQIPLSLGSRDSSLEAPIVVVSVTQLRGLLETVLNSARSESALGRSTAHEASLSRDMKSH